MRAAKAAARSLEQRKVHVPSSLACGSARVPGGRRSPDGCRFDRARPARFPLPPASRSPAVSPTARDACVRSSAACGCARMRPDLARMGAKKRAYARSKSSRFPTVRRSLAYRRSRARNPDGLRGRLPAAGEGKRLEGTGFRSAPQGQGAFSVSPRYLRFRGSPSAAESVPFPLEGLVLRNDVRSRARAPQSRSVADGARRGASRPRPVAYESRFAAPETRSIAYETRPIACAARSTRPSSGASMSDREAHSVPGLVVGRHASQVERLGNASHRRGQSTLHHA